MAGDTGQRPCEALSLMKTRQAPSWSAIRSDSVVKCAECYLYFNLYSRKDMNLDGLGVCSIQMFQY